MNLKLKIEDKRLIFELKFSLLELDEVRIDTSDLDLFKAVIFVVQTLLFIAVSTYKHGADGA